MITKKTMKRQVKQCYKKNSIYPSTEIEFINYDNRDLERYANKYNIVNQITYKINQWLNYKPIFAKDTIENYNNHQTIRAERLHRMQLYKKYCNKCKVKNYSSLFTLCFIYLSINCKNNDTYSIYQFIQSFEYKSIICEEIDYQTITDVLQIEDIAINTFSTNNDRISTDKDSRLEKTKLDYKLTVKNNKTTFNYGREKI